jgi:tartrate dehydrogenase/decarboxylase/D-malate dehydrogenase
MMLDFLGQTEAAQLMEDGVRSALHDQQALTPDLGGTGTTRSLSDAVLTFVKARA